MLKFNAFYYEIVVPKQACKLRDKNRLALDLKITDTGKKHKVFSQRQFKAPHKQSNFQSIITA